MTIPGLTKTTIRQQATAESFRRGQDYDRRGAVISLVQRGNTLEAEVEGSEYEPYRVGITFDQVGITAAECSCPYDWGGWCKHIVATLLACLHRPETVEIRPPLQELLAGLDHDQLQSLLLELAARDPGLVEAIEGQVSWLRSAPTGSEPVQADQGRSRRTVVDPQPIHRQVRGILHSLDRMRPSEAYWHVEGIVDQVRQMLDRVEDFLAAGDGRSALAILEAITDEYVTGWTCLDDSDGFAGEFFQDLGDIWPEALLTADLTPAERREWVEKLAAWQAEVDDYGIDAVFEVAQAAAEQGWDSPPLQRVLQGQITSLGAWDGEAPWYADDLAVARLNVLERQERYQEYLYLAEAEGQMGRYVLMLARLGRTQQAVDEGLQHLTTPDEFLALAQILRERGEMDAALRVAEHGLALGGSRGRLATWLRDLAQGMGDTELALRAAVVAFQADLSLNAYLKVQELAREGWPALQAELLAHLRQAVGSSQAQVDIFLHEGLVDEAIAAVRQSATYDLLGRVMDAAVNHRPEWVIEAAGQQAERIMDAGKSQYYHHAITWLERARAGYRAAGREAEWQTYLRDLRTRHARKYKLMEMLKGLDRR